jgi:hypothetical protein
MSNVQRGFVLCLALVGAAGGAWAQRSLFAQVGAGPAMPAAAEQLYALANEARATAGAGRLQWDPALAAAALKHCQRMVAEGPIAHRYGGEPDLTERAGQAGAHFSLIEENIAIGPDAAAVHDGWMHSPDHRANLLNPAVDRVGVAVVASHGVLYAVADYSRAVPALTQAQVEAAFAGLLRASGVMVLRDTTGARAYCASAGRYQGSDPPSFLMRWQNADVTHLPQPLVDELVTGRYRKAEVGSCPAQDVNGAFTVYRVAVLLY